MKVSLTIEDGEDRYGLAFEVSRDHTFDVFSVNMQELVRSAMIKYTELRDEEPSDFLHSVRISRSGNYTHPIISLAMEKIDDPT